MIDICIDTSITRYLFEELCKFVSDRAKPSIMFSGKALLDQDIAITVILYEVRSAQQGNDTVKTSFVSSGLDSDRN
jgi:hypothetical protein